MTNYVEVTHLMDFTPDEGVIEIGKKYEVVEDCEDGVYIYANKSHQKYFVYNNQIKRVEEKEMKKYAKITKYAGLSGTDKENGLEIGKEYEIVKFSSVSEDCYIYLNEEHPSYFISEIQNEEEKEVPTLEAKADVKEVIQAKIDALTIEAERLFTKRDRLEQHAINLNAKARKLEEVLETIKEFE